MDGAIGLIRVAYDFSVWPVDGHSQTAGSANIFTAVDACSGSTCIPWHETMAAEHVVSAVVSHVLYNVSNLGDESVGGKKDPTKVPRLRREWSRVLRLALVVDHSVPSVHYQHNNHRSPGRGAGGTSATVISHSAQPSSLVLVKPGVPLTNQPNVIQALRTSGTIRSLDTAIVVIPYDDQAARQLAARQDIVEGRRRRQLLAEATAEEIDRRVAKTKSRNDAYRVKSDALKAGFDSAVSFGTASRPTSAAGGGGSGGGNDDGVQSSSSGDALESIAALSDELKELLEKKQASLRNLSGLDEHWKRELAVVEQDMHRLEGRIALFLGEKAELETLLEQVLAGKRARGGVLKDNS